MMPFTGRSLSVTVPRLSSSLSRFNGMQAGVVGLGRLLSHMHYGPTSLEMNFIHQRSHQIDATAVRGLKLFCGGRVREFGAVKSHSFVSDLNGDFLLGRTSADDVNMLVRVFMIAVKDSICQGFSQRNFNVDFASGHTSASLDEQHELIYKRRDCGDCTSN
jgi:hypothetical protein